MKSQKPIFVIIGGVVALLAVGAFWAWQKIKTDTGTRWTLEYGEAIQFEGYPTADGVAVYNSVIVFPGKSDHGLIDGLFLLLDENQKILVREVGESKIEEIGGELVSKGPMGTRTWIVPCREGLGQFHFSENETLYSLRIEYRGLDPDLPGNLPGLKLKNGNVVYLPAERTEIERRFGKTGRVHWQVAVDL